MDAIAADKKKQATRTGIKNALLRLMEKKSYHDISVPDIVLKASVARCTFYRHFPDKDSLLLACCNDCFEDLNDRMQSGDTATFHGMSLTYFNYWAERKDFLMLLARQELLGFFQAHYDSFLRDVADRSRRDAGSDAPPAKVLYHFFCSMSAMSGILMYWLGSGCTESAEELSQYYVSFIAEGSRGDADCRFYAQHGRYEFDPCYV